MPIYEYRCAKHGVFEHLRPMAESSSPCACPACAEPAPRILSAPCLSSMKRSEVIARDRNEKSQHEPHVSTGSSCQHHHHAKTPAPRKPTVYNGPRPWVIEHA